MGEDDYFPSIQNYHIKPLWFEAFEQLVQRNHEEVMGRMRRLMDSICVNRKETEDADIQTETLEQEPYLQAEPKMDIEAIKQQEEPSPQAEPKMDIEAIKQQEEPLLQDEPKTDIEAIKQQEEPPLRQKTITAQKYLCLTAIFPKFQDKDDYRMISSILTEYPIKNTEEEEYHYWIQTSNLIFDKIKNGLQLLREMLQFMTDNFKIKS